MTLFQTQIYLALETSDFFDAETPVPSACALGLNHSRFFPAFNGCIADAAETSDFFGCEAF
jgi:hypothetical protein